MLVANGRCLAHRMSGVERYTLELTRRLSEHVRVIRPTRWDSGVAGHVWEQTRLPRLVGRTDLLWSPANSGPLAIRRQVVTIHDVSVIDHPEWFHPAFAAWYRMLLPRLAARVRAVVTNSEFSKSRIVERLRVPESRVTAAGCGVDRRFSPRPAEEIDAARARYQLRAPYVLTVGSLQPRKNLGTLFDAWTRTPHDRVELVVAGVARQNFSRVQFGSLPASVRFIGFADDEWLPALYSGAMFVAVPSLYEGFGLPALEAMSAGAPVLAAAGSGLDHVVGDAGVRVNPRSVDEMAAGIQRLLTDADLRAQLRAAGLERARRFSWDATAKQVLEVLNEAARD